MSITFQTTPSQFQPVLSDGIFFVLSSSTYNSTTTFKFKYNYELYVEEQLVFEGKCSPNPYGLGIVDLQQILETYTDSLPISYWDTTPIYTHQTFPFSRPANDEVINYFLKVGYEYANSELAGLTGFTGYGNSQGPPAVQTDVFKVFRSTMGTNPRATQQDFDIEPFVLSGQPQGVYPTTSGLFLTNAPRILDVLETDYFTLGFTNYYLWSGATSGLSEGYYVEYNFYDNQGTLLSATTYDNILANGGGPRNNCNLVYQNLYLIEPITGTTDYNTLYVAAGPANLPEIPAGTVQYTVQLFGKFTGTTEPIQPSPTPTPTPGLTPTPSITPSVTPTSFCGGCTEYQLNYTGETVASVSITNCSTGVIENLVIVPNLVYNICSCTYPITELAVTILTGGPCGPTPTPSNTPSSTPTCVCGEYVVENLSYENTDFIQYINCYGNPTTYALPPLNATTICACINSIESAYSEVTYLGPCVVPQTPTPTRTPTMTPTPSSTGGECIPIVIQECTNTCPGGQCGCDNPFSVNVYTAPGVLPNDIGATLYTDCALTIPYFGDYQYGGDIYSASPVAFICNPGGPC